MKVEFSDNYHEFFKGAMDELQKTITVKLYCMKNCNQVLEKWVSSNSVGFPNYNAVVEKFSNRQMNSMTHEQIIGEV